MIKQSLYSLVSQSDLFTQFLVFALCIGAFISIIASFYVYFILKHKINLLEKAEKFFSTYNMTDIENYCTQNSRCFLQHGVAHIKQIHVLTQNKEALSEAMITFNENYSQKEYVIIRILGALAAISPLLGLLGTVWGIINAFLGMSMSGGADLAAIAPGIAEALITTLAGLFVAIPSLFFYHALSIKLETCREWGARLLYNSYIAYEKHTERILS